MGRTHDADFSLYRVGSFASPGLKKFAESGNSAIIDTFSQGTTGVCDAFTARPILKGVGRTETQFFADGNHSKVTELEICGKMKNEPPSAFSLFPKLFEEWDHQTFLWELTEPP